MWAQASTDPDFAWGEAWLLRTLAQTFPDLREPDATAAT
jgi:hypothetical protein